MYSALLLPYVYKDEADIETWRKHFISKVEMLEKKQIRITEPERMDGVPQYYLSYHGRNDSAINHRISRMFRAAAPVSFKAQHIMGYKPKAPGEKIRLGFMSYYFRDHSVSKMIAGLFKHLDKSTPSSTRGSSTT